MSAQETKKITRRNFLALSGWFFFFASFFGFLASNLRFMMPNILYEPVAYFRAGKPTDFAMGVDERWMKEQRVWIVRTEKGVYALYGECRHLGCTPGWFPDQQLFKCPCHGSNYTIEGDVVAGPAPRPLYRVSVSITPDGQILVNKNIKNDVAPKESSTGNREGEQFLLKNV